MTTPSTLFQERVWRTERRLPDPARVREAVDMLRAAKRPLIIAGGGVLYSEAEAELLRLAERFGLPVGETMAGKGAILATSFAPAIPGPTGWKANTCRSITPRMPRVWVPGYGVSPHRRNCSGR